MSAGESAGAANRVHRIPRRAAALKREQRRFWIIVASVAAVHAALILGAGLSMSRQQLRQIGERDASKDGISVVLVDAADLESKTTVPDEPPPGAPISAAPPPPVPPSPAEEAHPTPPTPPAPKQPKGTTAAIDKELLELPPEPGLNPKQGAKSGAAKEPRESKEKAKSTPARDQPMQLSMPDLPTLAPGERATAVMRPPGITRSGENDDFARGVIRALRRTMPASNIPTRVTIR